MVRFGEKYIAIETVERWFLLTTFYILSINVKNALFSTTIILEMT